MTEDELIDSLCALQGQNLSPAEFNSQFKKTLQDYLWEGVPKSKYLKKKKYHELMRCIHPDALLKVNHQFVDGSIIVNRLEVIHKKDDRGELIKDENGEPIIDTTCPLRNISEKRKKQLTNFSKWLFDPTDPELFSKIVISVANAYDETLDPQSHDTESSCSSYPSHNAGSSGSFYPSYNAGPSRFSYPSYRSNSYASWEQTQDPWDEMSAFLRYFALSLVGFGLGAGLSGLATLAAKLYFPPYTALFLSLALTTPITTIISLHIALNGDQTYQNPGLAYANTVEFWEVAMEELAHGYHVFRDWIGMKHSHDEIPDPSQEHEQAQKPNINPNDYWQIKLAKYMCEDEPSLIERCEALTKSSKNILILNLGFTERDPIHKKLAKQIEEATAGCDKDDNKLYTAKQATCLRIQKRYLKDCQAQNLSPAEVDTQSDSIAYPRFG